MKTLTKIYLANMGIVIFNLNRSTSRIMIGPNPYSTRKNTSLLTLEFSIPLNVGGSGTKSINV